MTKPSTAEYQRYRKDTLRGAERERVLKTARKLMAELRAKGHYFPRSIDKTLKGQAP